MRIHTVPTVILLGAGVVLLLVAGALFLKGVGVRRSAERFRSRAVEVTATVVGLEAKDIGLGSEPDTRYFPRVTFVPEGATEPVEAQTLTDIPAPPPRVGEEIRVAYDPDRPDRVDVVVTEGTVEGAGRTWNVMAALVLIVALSMPVAWLILSFVVWTA
jgi:uncharacterized protein DUF3592